MIKLLLLPIVLIALVLNLMGLHIMGASLIHRYTWTPTIATATSVETRTVTKGSKNPTVVEELYGEIAYSVDGKPMRWAGRMPDAGIYQMSPGQKIEIFYNPADPQQVDTAAMKGWLGALLLLGVTGAIVGAYAWFFWLRGSGGSASPPRFAPAAPSRNMPPPRMNPQLPQRQTGFGRRT